MTAMDPQYRMNSGLPDPVLQRGFYADVPAKRLIAWVVDTIVVTLLTVLVSILTLGLGFFLFAGIFLVIGFIYRWTSIAARSATPGMRLVAIELRAGDGGTLDGLMAALHTLGYYVSTAIFPLQLVSIVLMLTGSRRQGLTDLVLGTAAINRAARF